MFKRLFVSSLFYLAFLSASVAQSTGFNFTHRIEPYQSLEQSVPISSATNPWYTELWTIPIGFPFSFMGSSFDSVTVYCASSLYFGFDMYEDALHFAGFSQAITDRGWATEAASLSPISYELTGNEPNRVCKIEFKNAGFDLAPAVDSVYLQIWLLETNNAIEVHLGPHHVSSPQSYESIGATGPFIGILNDLEETYELLYGNAQTPTFGYPPASFLGLNGNWPDGKVYTFTPSSVPIKMGIKGYPKILNIIDRATLVVKNLEVAADFEIFDAKGALVKAGRIDPSLGEELINYDLLVSGWHVLTLRMENQQSATYPFVSIRH